MENRCDVNIHHLIFMCFLQLELKAGLGCKPIYYHSRSLTCCIWICINRWPLYENNKLMLQPGKLTENELHVLKSEMRKCAAYKTHYNILIHCRIQRVSEKIHTNLMQVILMGAIVPQMPHVNSLVFFNVRLLIEDTA